jgi:hypothetical protein
MPTSARHSDYREIRGSDMLLPSLNTLMILVLYVKVRSSTSHFKQWADMPRRKSLFVLMPT